MESREYVSKYKEILRKVLENRPSGTRQKLAEALGKNRSFISQISNPAYHTPIPAKHLETIFQKCYFSAAEKQNFLKVYSEAHPNRPLAHEPKTEGRRQVTLDLKDLGDADLNNELDRLLAEFAIELEASFMKFKKK